MAIEDYSAIWSPRVSFSDNLSQFDKVHSGKRSSPSASSNLNEDFKFPSPDTYAVVKSLYADELFTGGRILTAEELKKQNMADKTRAKQRGTPDQPELALAPALSPQRGLKSVVMKPVHAMKSDKELGSKNSCHIKNKGCRRIKWSNSLNTLNSCKPCLRFLPLVSWRSSTGSAPPRTRTGLGRLDWRSRVSPVTSVASKDVFGLSTLFMSRRTSSIRLVGLSELHPAD